MAKTVLITRERDAAIHTASKLLALGYQIVVAPLIRIELTDIPLDHFQADYLLVTSFNAAKQISALYNNLDSINALVVGQKSAKHLSKLGIQVIGTFSNSDDLLAQIAGVIPNNNTIEFVCGDHIANNIDTRLSELGYSIHKTVAYESRALNALPMDALQNTDIVMFHSPRAANIFSQLSQSVDVDLSKKHAVCISSNTAKELINAGFGGIHISNAPNENSMLDQCYAIN